MNRVFLVVGISLLTVLTGCFEDRCGEGQRESRFCETYGSATSCTRAGDTVTCREIQECTGWSYSCYPSSGLFSRAASMVKLPLKEISVDRAMSMIARGDEFDGARAGLVRKDIETVMSGGDLPELRVQELAAFHGVTTFEASAKINAITTAFASQRGRTDSVYWQTCIQNKKWATPQNSSCSETFWTGCSPETGANLCVAAGGLSRLGF